MKKSITLSLIGFSLISGVNANAAEDLSSMFSEGKASGQIRTFYIDRTYQGSAGNTTYRNGLAVGGHLKFQTADYEGLSFAAAFYTTNKLTSSPTVDPSLFGPNNSNYNILGEAYAQYVRGNTTLKIGRQKLDTPLAGSDDARMLPNLFEAYVVTNKDIANTTLIAAHVTKFAQGTFGRVYSSSSAANQLLSVTSGYSYVDPQNQVGGFVNMGAYALGSAAKNDGVTAAAAIYAPNKNLKIQLWDYYAYDILNAIYAEVNYNMPMDSVSPYVGAQLIKENGVGNKFAGSVNGLYAAVKAGVKVAGFNVYAAYSQTSKNDAGEAATANAIITPWGGMPAYTQGMVTRHMFLAGTKAAKIAATYNFKDMGLNLSATGYYTSFDMDANSGYGIARTASEPGFDFIYNPEAVKNLQVRFRGNFPRKFHESTSGSTGWDEYRFIVNYNF